MKKLHQSVIFSLIFLLVVSFIVNFPGHVKAVSNDNLSVKAKSAILLDANTGKILYEKNADVALPPASMTKMMTEYLVQEYMKKGKLNWDTKISISEYPYKISQNRAYSGVPLRMDYQYTAKELYEAMAIYSDNAATIAFAEKIAGSEANFVKLMNQKAKEFDMKDTRFFNSSGLDNKDLGNNIPVGTADDSNLMSARDLAKLAYHIVKDYPEALQVSSIPRKKFTAGVNSPVDMPNWNWMIPGIGSSLNQFSYPNVDGLKTGYTKLAGYCFTGTVEKDGHRLISAVMGTDSKSARFVETKKLFDYGFNQFTLAKIADKGYQFKGNKSLPVTKGKEDHVAIATDSPLMMVIPNGDDKSYKTVLSLDKKVLNKKGELTAPVKKGDKVGTATVTVPKKDKFGYIYPELKRKVAVVATEDVDKANAFVLGMRAIGYFISSLFSGATNLLKGIF